METASLIVFLPIPLRYGTEAGPQHRRRRGGPCRGFLRGVGAAEAAALQVVPGQQQLDLRDVARNASVFLRRCWALLGPWDPIPVKHQ